MMSVLEQLNPSCSSANIPGHRLPRGHRGHPLSLSRCWGEQLKRSSKDDDDGRLTFSSRRRRTREEREFRWSGPCSGLSGGPAPACWSQERNTSSSKCFLEKREKSNHRSIINNNALKQLICLNQVPHLVSWLQMKTRRQRWLFYGGSSCLCGCGPSPDHNNILSSAPMTADIRHFAEILTLKKVVSVCLTSFCCCCSSGVSGSAGNSSW